MALMSSETFDRGVKAVVTVAFTGTICYGFLVGSITTDGFLPIASGAIMYWFGTRSQATRATDISASTNDTPTPPKP